MKVLVLNCGSSSLKYQLFDMPSGDVLAKGLAQKIGEATGQLDQESAASSVHEKDPLPDHAAALRRVVQLLGQGVLKDVHEIGAVGHRVVHGGERFTDTVRIDDAVVAAIEDHVELAPLHNPANLLGIRVARELLPEVHQVAVFDTAFHQTMPPVAYHYALPVELYAQARVRRYGFHGTSHRYVAARAAAMLGRSLEQCNLITCHLGNGSSMAAIRHGRSVDTSMGLTPLEGLVMGTRSGDLDPAIVFHLARVKKMNLDDIDKLLNKKSGLLGLSGTSNDMRELLARAGEGDAGAQLAVDVFCYRIKKYIGAYSAVLGHVDAVVFTAGIGENAAPVRLQATAGLEMLGIAVDEALNAHARGETDVSAPGARVKVLVIPTNEEKMIAQETFALAHA
ncbi:MAG: acetate kinase [Pseudomonadota bacterium]